MDQSFCLVGGLCYSLFNQQKHEMSKKDGKNEDDGKNYDGNDEDYGKNYDYGKNEDYGKNYDGNDEDDGNDGFINFSQITDYHIHPYRNDRDEFDWSISSKENSLKKVWFDPGYDDDICNLLSEENNDEIFEDINIHEENKKENFVIKFNKNRANNFNKNRANNLTLITRYLYSIKEESEDDE